MTEPGVVTPYPSLVTTEPSLVTTEPRLVTTDPGFVTTEPNAVSSQPRPATARKSRRHPRPAMPTAAFTRMRAVSPPGACRHKGIAGTRALVYYFPALNFRNAQDEPSRGHGISHP